MKVSIILPTYNEKDNIKGLIYSILKLVNYPTEIIVVDDNSPDETWKIVKKITEKNKDIKLLRRINKRGVASAIFDGISLSTGDVIIWLDADFSHPPELIPRLIKELSDYDISIASRYVKGGKDSREFLRVLTSKLINLMAQLLLNSKIKDYTTGFVAVNRYVFDKVQFTPKGHGEYCIEFLYKCKKAGYRIKGIPYTFVSRTKGESKTSGYALNIRKYGLTYVAKIIKIKSLKTIK